MIRNKIVRQMIPAERGYRLLYATDDGAFEDEVIGFAVVQFTDFDETVTEVVPVSIACNASVSIEAFDPDARSPQLVGLMRPGDTAADWSKEIENTRQRINARSADQ
jgi:hypothetical protein